MKFGFFGLTAAAGLTAVVAVSIPRAELTACSSAINSLLSSPDPEFQCIAPGSLNDIISVGSTNTSADVFGSAVDAWLTRACGVGACSSDTLSHISGNLTACGADPSFNVTEYSAFRELVCLKDTVANKFCVTESFTQIGAANFTAATPEETIFVLVLGLTPFGATCNECTKAQYQLAVKAGNSDFQPLTQICGANFTATLNTTAVGITQAAVNSEFKANSKNGARALSPTASLLLLVFGTFALV
ncbi:hypothetical protein B0H17DRAFT_1211385 [Mycena rosella]|uniref:Secreted protein n=1 Tax=Mycena rosella TaxID=1033263 RepID=A0AAD7G7T1_MYCRO|nr:hypothetical protein B0H17DRAFT_1211385 [Mycena rosella]